MDVKVIKANSNLMKRSQEGVKDKIRVAAYCRVSTDSEEQLSSYESQVNYYKELISSMSEWELVDIFADEAISGTKVDKREEFQKMILLAMDGKIDLVITKSISRFARNTVDTLKYVRMLKEKNVAVQFEEENINTLTMDGELLLTILSSVAQQEVHNTSEHVKKGLKMKMERGELIGFQGCLGYDYDTKTKTISVNEKEAEIVRYIFKRYLEGVGTTVIARELGELGYSSGKKYSKGWYDSTVRDIIKNEKYKGDILLGKTFTVDPINKRRLTNKGESDRYYLENHHEAIIDEETFRKANEIMERRACPRRPRNQFDRVDVPRKYAFSSMCNCGFCGASLTRRVKNGIPIKNGRRVDIWQCSTATKDGKRHCKHSLAIDEDMIKKAFVEGINSLAGDDNKELLDGFINSIEQALTSKSYAMKISDLEKTIESLKKKKDNVLELEISGIITKAELQTRYAKISSEIELKEGELQEVKSKDEVKNGIMDRLNVFKEQLYTHNKIEEFSREIFEATVLKVIIGGKDENGNVDPFKINIIFKIDDSLPGQVKDVDMNQVIKLNEIEIDYQHCRFITTEEGDRRKETLYKVPVVLSVDIGKQINPRIKGDKE